MIQLSLDSKFTDTVVQHLFLLTFSNQRRFVLSQTTTDSTGLLLTKISGNILSLSILKTEGFTLLLGEDGQDAGDGFTDRSTKLKLNMIHQNKISYIWAILEGAPLATCWTRREESSVLRSASSWRSSESFFLRSSKALAD
jgi:hypothetical protein